MADLIGIQILGLTPAPSLADNTYFPVQRTGIDKSEKVSLQNLSSYLVNSTLFSTFIDTSVASKVAQHTSASDPHGDRAFASTLLQNHLTGNDPHGDRAYSDNKLTTAIQTHISANDPHGDRAYTSTSIQAHSSAIDPHGDRAYTDGKVIDNLTASKAYTDSEINLKVTTQKGVTLAPLVVGKIPTQYVPEVVVFNPRVSFPTTGSASLLYTDTTNNDIYRWNGTTYINLTPEVDVANLNLTTDNVAQGVNVDRKYLTQALKTEYDNKIGEIINSVDLETKNSLIKETSVDRVVSLKNIVTESSLSLIDNEDNIIITDNVYTYEVTSLDDAVVNLESKNGSKSDILSLLEDTNVYNIKGNIDCISFNTSGETKYVTNNERISIDASVGLFGVLEEIAIPTDLVINSAGSVITGKALANKQVKIYNSLFAEISTANVLADTNFTANLTTPITDGSPLYVYTVDGIARSEGVIIYTPNKVAVRQPTLLSVNSTGLSLTGVAERNSTISVLKTGSVEIGTTTSNNDGFFTVTLSEAVIEEQDIEVKVTNEYTITATIEYASKLSTIVPPSEVKLNNDRTKIQGKAEPDSTIKILDSVTELGTFTVNGSGVFTGDISVELDIEALNVVVTKDAITYTTELLLVPSVDETNKPTELPKVISSEFKVLRENKENLNSKNNYVATLVIEDGVLLINVSNSENVTTKWSANLKITTVEL